MAVSIERGHNRYGYTTLLMSRSRALAYYKEVVDSEHNELTNEQVIHLERRYQRLQAEEELETVSTEFKHIQELHACLLLCRQAKGDTAIHLHEMIKGCELELPSPAPITRSPELIARLDRFRRHAEESEYADMTRNLANGKFNTDPSIGKEIRQMDSQLTFMFNFILTVVASFVFGYKASEYAMQEPNVSLQLTVGVTLATIVFFADVYFIVRDIGNDVPKPSTKLKTS